MPISNLLLQLTGKQNLVALPLVHGPSERSEQLAHLLLDGHFRHQILYTLGSGERCILVGVFYPILVEIDPVLFKWAALSRRSQPCCGKDSDA